ncbi:hypothetical protein K0M31_011272 [Melipona bicolor]|uniref:Uncharacterized protein n=1 Tax=Melipona bicolor TaxID=60889 RepID=A0AA40G984_9HYME|nr:hypothetical protein K0M31_011272 [Melipona bicolor]
MSHFRVDRRRSPEPKRVPLPLRSSQQARACSWQKARRVIDPQPRGSNSRLFFSFSSGDSAINASPCPCLVVVALRFRQRRRKWRPTEHRENVRRCTNVLIRKWESLRNRIDDDDDDEAEEENEGKQETRRTKKEKGVTNEQQRRGKGRVGKEKEEELATGQNPEGVAKAASQEERKRRNIEQELMFPGSGSLVDAGKRNGPTFNDASETSVTRESDEVVGGVIISGAVLIVPRIDAPIFLQSNSNRTPAGWLAGRRTQRKQDRSSTDHRTSPFVNQIC